MSGFGLYILLLDVFEFTKRASSTSRGRLVPCQRNPVFVVKLCLRYSDNTTGPDGATKRRFLSSW